MSNFFQSIYCYIKDHLGNIRVTVNQDGDVVTKDDYYPFGLQMPGMSYNSGNSNDRLKYSSKELDEEIGLKYHFGWRDYDPELGRWFVVDPARQGASPYIYCGNSPIVMADANGQFWEYVLAVGQIAGSIYNINNAYKENSWQGAFNQYQIESINIGLTIATGYYAPSGILPGMGYGAVTGGITGGINSYLSGDSFGDGFKSGAISG